MKNSATFHIMDVFYIIGRGVIVTGVVKSGEILKGMWGNIDGMRTRVLSIELFNKLVTRAGAGQNCAILLEGVKKENIKRGQIISFEK